MSWQINLNGLIAPKKKNNGLSLFSVQYSYIDILTHFFIIKYINYSCIFVILFQDTRIICDKKKRLRIFHSFCRNEKPK